MTANTATPNDDSWEARMAARHRERQRAKERAGAQIVSAEQIHNYESAKDRPWLNGWPRIAPSAVLIGSGTHCVCCGRLSGVTCVALTSDWQPPGPDPKWPFTLDDCPLCLKGQQ